MQYIHTTRPYMLLSTEINKWLKEGHVELTITRVNMHGPPGAGKTCAQLLLLNEDPPVETVTNSTPIARSAVLATRVSCNEDEWERVSRQKLLEKLATDLKEASVRSSKIANETSEQIITSEANLEHTDSPLDMEIEPSESLTEEPLAKSNNDVMKEVVDLIPVAEAQLRDHDHWVYIIDSGGQPAFQELLPLFVRTASVNVITIDLSKDIEEKLEFRYRINGHEFDCGLSNKYSNKTFVEMTVRSRTAYKSLNASIPMEFLSEPTALPPHPEYLVLGTHFDIESAKKQLGQINKTLIQSAHCNKYLIPEKRDRDNGDSVVFPVDTLLPAKSKDRKEAGKKLCKLLSEREGTFLKIKIPIRCFAFELQLQKEAEDRQRSFLTIKEVFSAGEVLKMNEKDILLALKYLHCVTVILYFGDVLPNLVFVDPQPILEVLSRVLALTYVGVTEIHIFADPIPSDDALKNLYKFGMFNETLLDKLKSEAGVKIFSSEFQTFDFIKLLKHLHIIAEIEDCSYGDYFLPCALPSYDDNHPTPRQAEAKPLLYVWQERQVSKNCPSVPQAVPQGVFPLTIVHLLNQKEYEITFSPDPISRDFEYYRYRDAMSLRININKRNSTLHIINRYTHIEVYFTGRKELCPQIRELITAAIKSSSDQINITHDFVYAFACPRSCDCYCIVSEDQDASNCFQCPDSIEITDSTYWCWFERSKAVERSKATDHERSKKSKTFKRSKATKTSAVPQDVTLNIDQLQDVLTSLKKSHFSNRNWRKLGLALGLHEPTLDDIAEDHLKDVAGCLEECLSKWLRRFDNVDQKGGPTMTALACALKKIGEIAISEDIIGGDYSRRISRVRKREGEISDDDDEIIRSTKRNKKFC